MIVIASSLAAADSVTALYAGHRGVEHAVATSMSGSVTPFVEAWQIERA
jgi:hypothetical protein